MIKKLFLIFIVLSLGLNAKNMVRIKKVESGVNKQDAIQNAYWFVFEDAINTVLNSSAYTGNIVKSFKNDMGKDFLDFKQTHFRNAKERCNDLGEDGFECMVLANIDLDKLKALISLKSNSSSTMGKTSVEDLEIVLIDEVNNDLSRDFTKFLHSASLETGTDLRVEKKGTVVGRKGTNCDEIKKQKKVYEKKGKSYKKALLAVERKLKQCKDNVSVLYRFELSKLKFNKLGKDSFGSFIGTLTYNISMINTQTGREDNAITPSPVESFASNIDTLKGKLFKKAASHANSEMIDNLLRSISKKSRKKSKKKTVKYENFYTLIISNLTSDSEDRSKRRLIKNTIKKFKSKAIKNAKESSEFEQVYNFGTDEEIDTEEFSDTLYDMADSVGFRIRVTNKGDNILLIQFL